MEKTFAHGNSFWVTFAVVFYVLLLAGYGSFMEYKSSEIKKLLNQNTHFQADLQEINKMEISGVIS